MLKLPVREWVTVLSQLWRKQEQAVQYAHDNHNLHIKCFLCEAFLKNLLQFFVQVYSFFLCEWKTMTMLFNLKHAVNYFHLKDPEVLFRNWGLEVWRLRAEDCLLQPLQDKKTNTPACAYNSSELLLFSLWEFVLFSIMCSLASSFMLYEVIPYYLPQYILTMSHLCGLHWSACLINLKLIQRWWQNVSA